MSNVIIEQLEAERDRISSAIAALQTDGRKQRRGGKRFMSAGARAKIARAQRKRWKAQHMTGGIRTTLNEANQKGKKTNGRNHD